MRKAFYSGSFDPFTFGHLHVVRQASQLFDYVTLGIGINSDKARKFDKDLMQTAIKQVLLRENITNVEVICYDNLSAVAAVDHNCNFFVRGIRNGMDYEYEETLASINKELCGLDTIYVRAGNFGNVSSSMVRELLKYNNDVSKYLPKEVLELVLN